MVLVFFNRLRFVIFKIILPGAHELRHAHVLTLLLFFVIYEIFPTFGIIRILVLLYLCAFPLLFITKLSISTTVM